MTDITTATPEQIEQLKTAGYRLEDMGAVWGRGFEGRFRWINSTITEGDAWGDMLFSETEAWADALSHSQAVAAETPVAVPAVEPTTLVSMTSTVALIKELARRAVAQARTTESVGNARMALGGAGSTRAAIKQTAELIWSEGWDEIFKDAIREQLGM